MDPEIADAAITAIKRHFWYLTEECVPFVLFSDHKSAAGKKQIVKVKSTTTLDITVSIFPVLSRSSKLVSLVENWMQ